MFRLFCLLLLTTTAYGQQDSTREVRRLEVGIGYGQMDHNVDFTPDVGDEPLRGNNYGLAFRYFDHHLVGLQVELSYVEAGWQETFDAFPGTYRRETEYVELLLLTQFSVGRGAFQPLLQAGPYLSVPVGETQTLPEGLDIPDATPPLVYGYDFPFRLNYGLQAGLGFNLRLGPLTLQADGRYLVGFNDLVKTGETRAAISRRVGIGGRVSVFYALWQ